VENTDGNTPLHIAAYGGHLEIVKKLSDRENMNFNAQNKTYGETPLHRAIEANAMEVFDVLVHHPKVDVNVENTDGNTPLHLAAYRRDLEIVKKLFGQHCTALDLAHDQCEEILKRI
jgi:ankyrin repeat protein